jgi:hypothetical protein
MKPDNPPDNFYAAMKRFFKEVSNRKIKLVVLSPFIHNDPYQNYWIRKYRKFVSKLCAEYDCSFIDCYSRLEKEKYSSIPVADGYHLSKTSHYYSGN